MKNDSIRANHFLQVYENNSKKKRKIFVLKNISFERSKNPSYIYILNLST